MFRSLFRPALLLRALSCLLLLALVVLGLKAIQQSTVSRDFPSYFFSSQAARLGGSPYDYERGAELARAAGVSRYYPFIYPPPLAHALKLLPHDSVLQSQRMWWYGMLACLLTMVFLLARLLGTRDGKKVAEPVPGLWAFLAIGCALCLRRALQIDLGEGQINLLILALNVGTLYFAERKLPQVAGLTLATAILLKVSPVLLFLYLAMRREWRAVGWGAGWLAGLGATDLLLFGPKDWIDFRRVASEGGFQHSPHGLFPITHVPGSLPGFFSNVLGVDSPWIARLSLLVLATMVAFLLILGRRGVRPEERGPFYGAVALTMMLSAPLVWFHHFIYLIPALALLAQHLALRMPGAEWKPMALLGGLASLALPWHPKVLQVLMPTQNEEARMHIDAVFDVPTLVLGFVACLYLWSRARAWVPTHAVVAAPHSRASQEDGVLMEAG